MSKIKGRNEGDSLDAKCTKLFIVSESCGIDIILPVTQKSALPKVVPGFWLPKMVPVVLAHVYQLPRPNFATKTGPWIVGV